MSDIDQILQQYGYLAIFFLLMMGIVGPLIPDETILVIAGILVHRGELQYGPTLLAAYAGSFCGITMSYAIGLYGFGWVERNWAWFGRFSARHLIQAEVWFTRYGKWSLFFGYFVAGVRHFTALFAGISRMPYRGFALYAYTGGLFWVVLFVSIGYFAGEQWEKFGKTMERNILVAVIVVVVVGAILWKWKHRTRRPQAP